MSCGRGEGAASAVPRFLLLPSAGRGGEGPAPSACLLPVPWKPALDPSGLHAKAPCSEHDLAAASELSPAQRKLPSSEPGPAGPAGTSAALPVASGGTRRCFRPRRSVIGFGPRTTCPAACASSLLSHPPRHLGSIHARALSAEPSGQTTPKSPVNRGEVLSHMCERPDPGRNPGGFPVRTPLLPPPHG